MKKVLVLFGGGGSEHEISRKSKDYLVSQIDPNFKVFEIEIKKNGDWILDDQKVLLTQEGLLKNKQIEVIDFVIPCIHGRPGEDGKIPAMLELLNIPFLGCKAQESLNCFNKLTTKSILDSFGISTVPFIPLYNFDSKAIENFFEKHQNIFIKANSEGSSIGCYHPKNLEQAYHYTKEAFKFSKFVLLEKFIEGRELEVAAFEFNNEAHFSKPGEIITNDKFYDFDEKYSNESTTNIKVEATLDEIEASEIKLITKEVFEIMNLRHLSRIDFFKTKDKIYVNEINTFPGMTNISLFPKMMEKHGVSFSTFLNNLIQKSET